MYCPRRRLRSKGAATAAPAVAAAQKVAGSFCRENRQETKRSKVEASVDKRLATRRQGHGQSRLSIEGTIVYEGICKTAPTIGMGSFLQLWGMRDIQRWVHNRKSGVSSNEHKACGLGLQYTESCVVVCCIPSSCRSIKCKIVVCSPLLMVRRLSQYPPYSKNSQYLQHFPVQISVLPNTTLRNYIRGWLK